MKTIPIVLLADRNCSTTRAYLTYMATYGYTFEKILAFDFIGSNPHAILAERALGRRITRDLLRLYHWKLYKQERARHFKKLCNDLQESFKIKIDYFTPLVYEEYSKQVENVILKDFSDEEWPSILKKQPAHTFLYTGGGIVPNSLLTMPKIRFLHLHPGVVPDVKGSDGLLWSIVIRGQPGVSCFFMNSGIDTGDIIAVKDFDIPSFTFSFHPVDDEVLYKALLYAYDPHLRASLLLDVVRNNEDRIDFNTIPSHPQTPGNGRTFFTMHNSIKTRILHQLVKGR